MQYIIEMPVGKTLTDCVKDKELLSVLRREELVSVIGKRADLIQLNISGTIIFEGLKMEKTSEEILVFLIRTFAKDKQMGYQIFEDYWKFICMLEEKGFISER